MKYYLKLKNEKEIYLKDYGSYNTMAGIYEVIKITTRKDMVITFFNSACIDATIKALPFGEWEIIEEAE